MKRTYTCTCSAYAFPHRRGSGACEATAPEFDGVCTNCGDPCYADEQGMSDCCEWPITTPDGKVFTTEPEDA